MGTPFRWGIIGPGRIAHTFAKGLAVVEGAALHAVATRDPARGAAFAGEYGAAAVYDTYEALAGDPAVDAIYIATPHRFHAAQALLCLEAGKPVLCEKPLTVNARETAALIEAARANKVFLMEALWSRYLPIYAQVRAWLDAGRIGEIKLLTSTFGFAMADRDPADRLLDHGLAGGVLLDLGVYNLAISQWVQRREPVSFAARALIGPTNVDELTAVTLQYEDGSVSQCACTLLAETGNDFTIYGSAGNIRIPRFWGPTEATLTTGEGAATAAGPWRATGFEYQIEEAMRCIREGALESPGISHADTLATMALMDRIRAEVGLRYAFER